MYTFTFTFAKRDFDDQALMKHPTHVDAKQRQQQWLAGYQVVIAQVVASYGDGGIAHPLAGQKPPAFGRADSND